MRVGSYLVVLTTLIMLWSLLLPGMPGFAEAQRQHRAHVHGAGKLNVVQEGKQVHIELEIPGMDLVGFEHQARTAAQKQAVKDAVAVLKKGQALFQINAAAQCTFDAVEIETPMLDDDHRDHEDHQHKKHEDEDRGETHAEFHAEYVLTCAAPEQLQQLRVALFDQFQGAESLQVQFITARKQGAQRINRGAPVVRFD